MDRGYPLGAKASLQESLNHHDLVAAQNKFGACGSEVNRYPAAPVQEIADAWDRSC